MSPPRKDLTAEELALEAMLESRLEIIASRISAFHKASTQLLSETKELYSSFDAKAKRMYVIEDFLLRLQGKPGLSKQLLVNGHQPRQNLGIGSSEIEEIKMGVKTLRRKFQAAGTAVSAVGWWRHLKDKANTGITVTATLPDETASSVTNKSETPAKLSVDTSMSMIATTATEAPSSPSSSPPPSSAASTPLVPLKYPSPKTLLSPTSPSTKKRNPVNLQQIFAPPANATAKQLHQHYLNSPSTERANPSLGLVSPPMSPNATGMQSPTSGGGLMRSFSLRS
ncbi:hypothetical protein BX616_000264 [Lobosporangium transversale]|uniref:Uncharacterized protein n=1 Tax=Lobosporangium transversale TaxID=64571 RepID=A0A1Y2GE26_9FUNG|nr:hypothetical protein BCR41DRAFT_361189 [Lobosporangium transversale]KAF9908019.1 hypothetical protein BX616_000264 [Lobosporangium transversale]ORZ06399.1 hypothetical protein BCR41DRAFT_361189 [Lobosporangium transversale]|eukprot:XP_021877562.1 hypothetical protein BCR41DRAFT_361189 [Lobosporangium transversale]